MESRDCQWPRSRRYAWDYPNSFKKRGGPSLTHKTCYRCQETKVQEAFKRDYKKKEVIKYSNICVSCSSKEFNEWRKTKRDVYNFRARDRRHKRKLLAIEYKGGVCEDCKQTVHHCAFDFHHVDPETKDKDPGLMMSHSDEDLFKELDKCILLCANCHRVRHFTSDD